MPEDIFGKYRPSLDCLQLSSKIDFFSGWFIIDFLAVFPFVIFFTNEKVKNRVLLLKMVRILRLPRFLSLLDSAKFDTFMEMILEKEPKNPREEKSRQEKMTIKYVSRYVYKVFRLILIALMLTYFLGCTWYFLVDIFEESATSQNFMETYDLRSFSEFDRMIICCYFVLTTLSTVGYGDMSP